MMSFHGYFWIWGLLNIGLFLAWFVLSIIGLVDLRKRDFTATAKALWAFIVLVIPVMGAVALFVVNPRETPQAFDSRKAQL